MIYRKEIFIPKFLRIAKHGIFQYFPGRVGLRNRACLRGLTRASAEPAFQDALSMLGQESLCIDCGANVGTVTLKMAATGAIVHAFEPDPWSYSRLETATKQLKNVRLHRKAVGARTGWIDLFRSREFSSSPEAASLASSIMKRTSCSYGSSVKIEVTSLTDFIFSLGREVDLIKIDVEGAECEIIEDLIDTGALSKVRFIFVETHELQFPELLERTEALRSRLQKIQGTSVNLDWH